MYLGIVKQVTNGMIGTQVKILTKTAVSRKKIEKWIGNYPTCQNIIIPYEDGKNEEIEEFFVEFEDVSPQTEKEKKKAQELLKKLMES